MDTAFEIISLQDAIAKYKIDENVYESREMFEDIVNPDGKFYLHAGNLVLNDHFILDTDKLPQGMEGYIITGNLEVKGNIINEQGDYGPALYVNGDVTCRSMLIGGSPTHITGNVTAEEVIMLHYNHGWMKCPGKFTAPVMIVEDYSFIPTQKDIRDFYYNDNDPDSPEANECFETETESFHISLHLQTLLDNKLTVNFEQLRYDLAAGEYVLKPAERDSRYWQQKVNHNYRDLQRVPMEMRTPEFCMQTLNKTVFAIEYFPPALFTPELALIATNKSGMALRYLPAELITRELCLLAAGNGAIIDIDIPERFYDEELLQILIKHNDSQMDRIPSRYFTEDLLVTYTKQGRGSWLARYCEDAGVSKERVLKRVIDDGVQYLENIFGWHFSADTYAYCKEKYDNETYSKEWAAITAQYKRKLERLQ